MADASSAAAAGSASTNRVYGWVRGGRVENKFINAVSVGFLPLEWKWAEDDDDRRSIAGGGKIDLLEGDPMPEGIFIIEFQTADAARQWYQSDDYQEALKVRLSSSRGRVFLIEGNEISSAVPVAGLDAGKN
jgi:hypothetical protein